MRQSRLSPNRSIGIRLGVVALGFCLVYTVLAVVANTYWTWKEAWSTMNADLTLIEDVYRHTLSKAVWEMDRDALKAHVDSASQVRAVGRVTVNLQSNQRQAEVFRRSSDGWQPSTLAPTRRLDLVYAPYPGGSEKVGELVLEGDERLLWSRLRGAVKDMALTQLLQSLLVAGLVMAVFSRVVTHHVRRIADHLAFLTPQSMDHALDLRRHPELNDELTLLERGINALQHNLTDHLEQLRQYENELGAHRDHLADLVQARTSELESLAQAQQLMLSLSNRLIHAPYATFAQSQQQCLQEVAQRLGANHLLWLVPNEQQDAFCLQAEWHSGAWANVSVEPVLARLPEKLEREELLFFYSQAELGRSLQPDELSVFSSQPVGACALGVLRSDTKTYGILFVGKPLGQGEWPSEDRALMAMTAQTLLHSVRHQRQLSHLLATQEALKAANGQLQALSLRDALTGLFNRRHFDKIKEEEFQRALRNQQPLSLLVCDIDQFKDYNDRYGHAQGDDCLRAVASAMNSSIVRSGDTLARIGGEEFAVLLPSTQASAAVQVAERMRQAVAAQGIAHAASAYGQITISIGLAQMDLANTPSFDALFDHADQALYRAKQAGRNRIESHRLE